MPDFYTTYFAGHTPSDWLLLIALPLGVAFVVNYGVLSPWYRSSLGRATFMNALSNSLLLGLIVYGIVYGQSITESVRASVALLVVAALIYKNVVLIRERHIGRSLRKSGGVSTLVPPDKETRMILNKYMVGLLQVLIISVTALQAAIADGLTETEVWQLSGLVVGAIVSVYVPLTKGAWAGALKVGGALAGALIAAVVPFLMEGWTPAAAVIVTLAVLNALATQIGVNVRVDGAREGLADPSVSNQSVIAVDPDAARIAERRASWRI